MLGFSKLLKDNQMAESKNWILTDIVGIAVVFHVSNN